MSFQLRELVTATHTPFHADGSLNLAAVEAQARHLLNDDVKAVFVCGTTGECHSLTVDERLTVARRWVEVARGTPMRVVVHVGSNCIADARALAADAQSAGAAAIAALPPTYFKPRTVDDLIACCRQITDAAPALPFYYYDIPSLSGVALPMADFLDAATDRLPTLAGLKFTNPDLVTYQRCIHGYDGQFDVPWGVDEHLLGALAVGAAGAVGSTYNFAAPLYLRLWTAFARGDLAAARVEQYRAVLLIQRLASYGYMGAAKAVMEFLSIPVGPPRLPNTALSAEQRTRLRGDLEKMGFFSWGRSVG